MYLFANILLCLLALAGLYELFAALRTGEGSIPGRFFAALRRRWREEDWLLGACAARRREALAFPLFITALCIHLSSVILGGSLLMQKLPALDILFDRVLVPAALVLLAVKLLVCTRYSWLQFTVMSAVYFIFRWVFFNAQDIWLFYGILFLVAAKDIPLEKAVRWFMVCACGCIALVMLLTAAGVLENTYWMDEYRERRYFGFSHPNTLGGFLMGLVCGWVFLRAKNWRWLDFIPLLAMELFNDFGPYVRSLQVVLRGMIVLLVIVMLLPRKLYRPKWVRAFLALGPIWLILFSFALLLWYERHPDPLIEYINLCLTGRIFLQSQGFQLYPIPIAGQVMAEWPNQDNAFIAALLRFGPVASALIWIACCIVLWQLLKKQRIYTALLFECMLVYAYFEIIFFHLPGNPALLLLSPALFGLCADRYTAAEPARDWD